MTYESNAGMVHRATEADIPKWLDLAAEVADLFDDDLANHPAFQEYLTRNVARGSAFCIHINGELAGAMTFHKGWIR